MLTETAVSTILTASITGAGLIIAIYALITPIARTMFEEKVGLHRKKKKEFDKLKGEIDSKSLEKDFERLKTLAKEIKGMEMFPKYLSYGVFLVFTFYIFTAMFAWGWLTAQSSNKSIWEFPTLISFGISSIGFLLVGMYAILDVYRAMKREFEQVKKEKEEVEKSSKEIERTKKVAEQIRKRAETMEKNLKHNQEN